MSEYENSIVVTKASGEKMPFSWRKLEHSLHRSGADDSIIEEVKEKLKSHLHDGISTRKIYKHAFNILRKTSKSFAARYKLKQAIMELGPSGYPFEKFISEILKFQGFTVQVGVVVEGNCVNHEIDVVAQKDEKHFMIECKFHNQPGIKSDVKIPLYIYARFLDVEKKWKATQGHSEKFHQGWLVTNTRFTNDAIQYGSCVGLHLMGWDYPKKESLNELIDASGLHPLTCMTTLTKTEKQQLLEKRIVLCKDLCQKPELLDSIGIRSERKERILQEGHELCVQFENQHQ